MPTSIEQVQGFLDEYDLRYRVDEERDAILISFGLDPDKTSFRDVDGDPGIQFVIRVTERGEFLSIFTPQAWNVEGCPHRTAVFEALASIQSRYKMLRFDYDPTDGEIRPNVELPLEDAELTSRQFHRLMHGMLHGVPRFDAVIRQAMATGEVSFASLKDDDLEGAPPPDIARLQRLAAEAGGLDEFERLACGSMGVDEEAGGGGGVDAEHASDTASKPTGDMPASGQPTPAADVVGPGPTPVIRRMWTRLFGGRDHGSDAGRRAG